MGLGQQQLDAAVGEHVGQAFAGVVRVQRHVGAARLDDRQQTDQQLRRTLGADRYPHVRADALVAQVVGQAVGPGVQFGVAEAAAVPLQGDAFGGLRQLPLQQLRQPGARRLAGRAAPFGEARRLLGVDQGDIAEAALRVFRDLAQ